MRNLHLEAAIWHLFTSPEYYEAAARECENTMTWFGNLAVSRQTVNFGRNNQIYDTFKKRAQNFRRGAELAALDDYSFIWEASDLIRGDVRGMMEQPLHSWMTEAEHKEFEEGWISRLLAYDGDIRCALSNAVGGAESFFDPDPDNIDLVNRDDGYPGDRIVEIYEDHRNSHGDKMFLKLPDPLPAYAINRAISCKTGDEVPSTGVWYPATGLENHSLTFAIKGLQMQPAYRVTKTTEEIMREDKNLFVTQPETIAVATTWYQLIPTIPQPTPENLQEKAGQPCPRAGVWQPLEPGAAQRTYALGEPMADLKSAYGFTVWRWIADR